MSNNPEKLVTIVDDLFGDMEYQDPDSFGGTNLLAIRHRYIDANDPETQTNWSLSDKIMTLKSSEDGKDAISNERSITLVRGEMESQIVFNLDIDADELTLAGLGGFLGNPRDEFVAGINIIKTQITD